MPSQNLKPLLILSQYPNNIVHVLRIILISTSIDSFNNISFFIVVSFIIKHHWNSLIGLTVIQRFIYDLDWSFTLIFCKFVLEYS